MVTSGLAFNGFCTKSETPDFSNLFPFEVTQNANNANFRSFTSGLAFNGFCTKSETPDFSTDWERLIRSST